MSMNVQDQTGKLISKPSSPLRIVSLVPSITELLFDLGLNDDVVGITKFCVHPKEWFQTKTRVGGTKTVSVEKVKTLQPNLILANKEENVKEQVEELAKEFSVYTSDITTVADAYNMMLKVGELTDTKEKAVEIVETIKTGLVKPEQAKTLKVLYLIWQKPYMAAGGDTFINDMLLKAGLVNVLQQQNRYPQLTVDEIKALNPDVLLLSSEPFPFQQKHADELKQLTGIGTIKLVDGEIFSWYGSRMLQAPAYFAKLRESLFLNDETAAQV
ncbi:MAG: ABC transporter substrate-binding protein [Chitinophagaceae bacterium]|nr:ABC transporter substrate-binding protein [Chitinophagaceae bacterium]